MDPNCKWSLRASRTGKTNIFVIRGYYHIHTCSLNYNLGDHHQASSNVIGDVIKSKFLSIKIGYNLGDIIRDMMDNHVSLSYDKALHSCERGIEMLRGKLEESYAKLLMYLHRLKETNPGSATDSVIDIRGPFKYMYMALATSIQCWKHYKPIMVVNETFLEVTHRGTLIIACTKDANENIFALAFAIVDYENNLAYEWFFKNFKRSFGEREYMCIILDRHEAIIHAVKVVYPNITDGACIFHLYKNLSLYYKGESLLKRDAFFGATKAYTVQELRKI